MLAAAGHAKVGPLRVPIGAEVILDDGANGTGRVPVALNVVPEQSEDGTGSVGVPPVQDESTDGVDLAHEEAQDEPERVGRVIVTVTIVGAIPEEVPEEADDGAGLRLFGIFGLTALATPGSVSMQKFA